MSDEISIRPHESTARPDVLAYNQAQSEFVRVVGEHVASVPDDGILYSRMNPDPTMRYPIDAQQPFQAVQVRYARGEQGAPRITTYYISMQ